MIKDHIQRISLIVLATLLVLCPICAEAASHKTKVAILPVNVRSAGPFSYIGPATEEILSTRLASDRISVVDPLEVRDLIEKGSISSPNIKDIAHRLGVDYILKGKITTKGKGIAMALDLFQAGSKASVLSLAFSPKSLNEVLPDVEDFARQAKGRILSPPVAAHASENKGVTQEVLQKKNRKDKGIMISRMHPDLLVRSFLKLPGTKKQASLPLDKKIYARALLIPPPRPLKIHKIEFAKRNRALPPIPPMPKAPAKKQRSTWFSWISEFWGSKEALAKEPPRQTLPYPPPPGTEQAGPGNEPIWQWY